jgi:predicted TIM-barrel fold metal-dependent hydrolase
VSTDTGLSAYDIRCKLDHPVIDADGHTTEFTPLLADYLRDEGLGTDYNALFDGVLGAVKDWYATTPEERVDRHLTKPAWWTRPMANTLDRATATFPKLLWERMDELGCDVSVVYPSTGLGFLQARSDEVRQGGCRALNRYHADAFAEYRDRLVPVAAVPANTPEEAIAELDFAVGELGFRTIVIPSYIPRPVASLAGAGDEVARWAFRLDTYGIDSAHDYDPFWQRCLELGVSIGTHTQGNGWGSRQSPSNWVYNHIGHFAASGEALCKSLFLGGVTRRFPGLRVALLEGGAAWACGLYGDLVGHWEKRNVEAIRTQLDPALLDQAEFARLAERYSPRPVAEVSGSVLTTAGHQQHRPSDAELDEFAALGISDAVEVPGLFVPNFTFGCEADDPFTSLAFRRDLLPYGVALRAVFGSDIGHFDVPDAAEVLPEAYEGVERGFLSADDFRAFTCTNPARFYLDTNPDFFAGTILEGAARELAGAPEG